MIKIHRPPGKVCLPSTWSPELLRPGRAQNAGQTESAALWSTREPEPERLRPGKCMQPRARFGQFPCRAPWSPSSADGESTHAMSGGTPGVVHTARSPHAPGILCAAFLPPHSSTEQASLNKCLPLPPCVRAEIRH